MPLTEIKIFKLFIVVFLVINSGINSNAQEKVYTVERLIRFVENTNIENEALVDSLNELSFLMIRSNLDSALLFAEKACDISKRIAYRKGLGDCHVRKGIINESFGKYEIGLEQYLIAKGIRESLGDQMGVAKVLNNIGQLYYYQEEVNKAIEHYHLALNKLSSFETSKYNGIFYTNLADVYSFSGDYVQALICLDSCNLVWDRIDNINGKAATLISQGVLNIELNNWKYAEENFKQSLAYYQQLNDKKGIAASHIGLGDVAFGMTEYAKATKAYDKAEVFKAALGVQDLAYLAYNKGIIAKKTGQINQAITYFKESKTAFADMEDDWNLASVFYELGNIAQAKKDYTNAEAHYLKCLEYCQHDCDLQIRSLTYLELSNLYSETDNHEPAYKYMSKYNALQDSVDAGFLEASKKQTELEINMNEKIKYKLDGALEEYKNLWFKGIILTLLLIALLCFFIFKSHQSEQQQLISEFKTDQAYLEIDDILRNKELEIAYAQLEAKDATQKKIGQDLHDRLGMMLSTIKLYFTEFSEQLNTLKTDTSQKQHKTLELLDEAVVEVRRISHDMQSGVLKKFGLVSAVKDLAETIVQSNRLKVEVNTHGLKERIPNNLEGKIYKIIQELISNVLKHSNAKQLTIYLHLQNDLFNLIVEDDGIGFDQNIVSLKSGMGLKNITYRVTELNGKCHFDSSPDKGTSVIIDIPITTL